MSDRIRGLSLLASAAAFAAAAVAPGHAAEQENLAALAEAAKAEGVITWCNGSIPDTAMQGTIEAFHEEYPELRLEGIRSTSQIAYQRLHQDLQMGMANCDLFSSSDYSHFIELKNDGHLFEYSPVREAMLPDAFAALYDPGFFYPGMVGTMLIAYERGAVDAEDAPSSWTDLLDARWKDQLAVGHPGYSGYVGTWVLMISDLYGWEYFEKLGEQNPMIGRSATDAITQLVSGERQVAISPGQTAIRANNDGANIALVYPEDGVLLMSSPVGIVANTDAPNGAKLVLEFMLGESYSRVMQKYGYEPLNRNVEPVPGAVPLDDIKTNRPSVDAIANRMEEGIEHWRDIFGG